jgi:hypothetical protein
MKQKLARDEELKRKRARRAADLLASQQARENAGDTRQTPPPAASRNVERQEDLRRAHAALMLREASEYQVGNAAVASTGARRDDEVRSAGMVAALLAREAPTSEFPAAPQGG